MLVKFKKRSNFAAGIWLVTLILLIAYNPSVKGNIWGSGDVIGISIMLVFMGSYFYAFWAYAKAKGYSGFLGLIFSILSFLGFIVLAFLKDKHPDPVTADGKVQLAGDTTTPAEKHEEVLPDGLKHKIVGNNIYQRVSHFVAHYFKEIAIALILAVVAGVIIDRPLESYKEKTASDILNKNLNAVATLIVYDKNHAPISQGSGFFINHKGMLATNYHVVKDGWNVEAKMPSGAYYKLKGVVKKNPDEDLIILQFDAKDTPSVEMGDSELLEPGQKIFAIGTPVGLESTVSEGIVSNPKRELEGHEFIQFTAPISPGNSGGGLFDKNGDAVGLTAATKDIPAAGEHSGTQNLNFAVPINKLKAGLAGEVSPLAAGSAAYYYALGNLADNEMKYDKAMELYEKAIAQDEKYTDAYIGLAGDYFMDKKFDLEVKAYQEAVVSDSQDADAHYYLGTAYEDIGDFNKAIDEFRLALSIDPDHVEALHDLAIQYIIKGNRDKAKALLPHLTELNPGWGRKIQLLLK